MEYWPDGWPKMSTVFPDGIEHGDAKITHKTVTEEEETFARMRMIGRGPRGGVTAGDTYAQLRVGRRLWMSDTRDERRDHWAPNRYAEGHVLIGGLGFGMVALAAALKPEVEKVTVIEINPDVIALVVPHLRNALESEGIDPGKLEVIKADLMTWKPPKDATYRCIWFDIWDSICTDNLPEYAALNRRFARRTDGYRGAWCEEELRRQRRQEKREESYRRRWW